MRNAQQAMNLHVNRLQSELEDLTARIERALESAPDTEGERSMEWHVGELPGDVVSALLEERRDRGWHWRWKEEKPFRTMIIFRRAAEAVPDHIPSA